MRECIASYSQRKHTLISIKEVPFIQNLRLLISMPTLKACFPEIAEEHSAIGKCQLNDIWSHQLHQKENE